MTVRRPVRAETFNFAGLKFVNLLTFGLPKSKVVVRAGSKRLENRVEGKALYFGGVGVFKDPDTIRRPHYNDLVSTP